MSEKILMPGHFGRKKQVVYVAPISVVSIDDDTNDIRNIALKETPADLSNSDIWNKVHEYDNEAFHWAKDGNLADMATELNSVVALEEVWFSPKTQSQMAFVDFFYPDHSAKSLKHMKREQSKD